MKSDFKDKIYTFTVENDDGSNKIEIIRTSNWEGLKPWQQLNMFKILLLQQSWSEDLVKRIRELDNDELEILKKEDCPILEEYR